MPSRARSRRRGSMAAICSSDTAPTDSRNQPCPPHAERAGTGRRRRPAARSRYWRTASSPSSTRTVGVRAAAQREARAQVDRALGRDARPPAARRRASPRGRRTARRAARARRRTMLGAVRRHRVACREERRHRHLLGLRRPRADVAEESAHRAGDVGRRDDPARRARRWRRTPSRCRRRRSCTARPRAHADRDARAASRRR